LTKKKATINMLGKTILLVCTCFLLSCGSNGGIVINGIPMDLALKTGHCSKAQEACKKAQVLEAELDARHDTASDDYFELRREYEAQLEACLDYYDACESQEY
jgi:hypothetical protein